MLRLDWSVLPVPVTSWDGIHLIHGLASTCTCAQINDHGAVAKRNAPDCKPGLVGSTPTRASTHQRTSAKHSGMATPSRCWTPSTGSGRSG
jgi:hypothetical protein